MIEHEKVKDLKQVVSRLEDDLLHEQQIKLEYESQLKRELQEPKSSAVQFSQSQVTAIHEKEQHHREQLESLRRELAKERDKNRELEELVEKNVLLYEHESKKTDTLQKEWQKEKGQAMHYKKRYTRTKETNDKRKKLITELENSIKELHAKLKAKELE